MLTPGAVVRRQGYLVGFNDPEERDARQFCNIEKHKGLGFGI